MRSAGSWLLMAVISLSLIACGGATSDDVSVDEGIGPIASPNASPEPVTPVPTPTSVPQPSPSPVASPIAAPTPVVAPLEPTTVPEPTVAPEPSAVPEPSDAPEPVFTPLPSPVVAPSPQPSPELVPSPQPSPLVLDQCDSTAQCRAIFGSSANDCQDSRSDTSVCMCGNERCDNLFATPEPEPSPSPVVSPIPSPLASPTPQPTPIASPSPSPAPSPADGGELGDIVTGRTLYLEHCAGCHQEDGLSTVFSLNNDTLNFDQMVAVVRDTMPRGNSGICGQTCAEDTTAYIKRVLFAEQTVLSRPPLAARLIKSHYINTLSDVFGLSLTDEEIALLPEELVDETSFVTVFDSQPLETGHILAYSSIARSLSERIDVSDFAQARAGCTSTSNNCRNALVSAVGKTLFRRPLNDEEVDTYRALFTEIAAIDGAGFDEAARGLLRALLQAPQFLYRTEPEVAQSSADVLVDPYALASRLSYFIWQSAPDDALLAFADDMADSGFSETALRDQVDRMFADAKASRALDTFWAEYTLSSTSAIQDASEQRAEELRESILRTVKRASGDSADPIPLQNLFTATDMVLTRDIAEDLGLDSLGGGYRVYDISSAPQRSGFLSHPGFLANIGSTSFVGRGTFLTHRVLCREIPAPPSNIVDEIDDTAEQTVDLTPRQASAFRFDLGGICLDCHQRFEPIAAAFEQFDVLGMHQVEDGRGRALFTDGYLQEANGDVGPSYDGVTGLMQVLEQSQETSQCFVSNMFLFGLGRDYVQADVNAIGLAHEQFIASGGTYEDLLKAVATSPLFRSIQTVTD